MLERFKNPGNRGWILFSAAGLVVLVVFVVLVPWSERSPHGEVGFNRDVRPILNRRCLACHGGVRTEGGFSLLFPEEALDTTASGRYAIVPGDPGRSELIRRITHVDPDERMPPEGDPLAPGEVETLRRWIAQGATWEDHWAYVPPAPQPLPAVSAPAWPRSGIDHFILARLDREGLAPSPEAGCATLLRRVSLDLTGLPPSSAEVEAFCETPTDDAYAHAVDRLLASPRFGEHWASMWLDLARYADTKGYEKDAGRSIWRYRDGVIDAFNRDLPFDQFTIWQLAGDLLPGATDAQVLATAFHRNTMTNDEGGTDDEEFRVAAVLDRVNTTFEVWQGTTMACVQCHSHPYDPFRHEEYFQLFAFFNNTEDEDRTDEQPLHVTYAPADSAAVEALLAWFEQNGLGLPPEAPRSLSERVHRTLYERSRPLVPARADSMWAITPENEYIYPSQPGAFLRYRGVDLSQYDAATFGTAAWRDGRTIELRVDRPAGPVVARLVLEQTGEQTFQRVLLDGASGVRDLYVVFNRDVEPSGGLRFSTLILHEKDPRVGSERRQAVHAKLQALAAVPGETTPILRERPPERRRTTRVFDRGNWLTPADTVAPDVPGTLPPMMPEAPRDRLGLARWLVDERNPLTARVTVNRFWARLFGRGLVETEEDFGTQGTPPSHPELLDWLALRFMHEHGWSVKQLLREIVTSATYRQSSRVTPALLERDPQNLLLARAPRVRLSAEQVRDQALEVSGLLSTKMHGPSVMPPQPPGVWKSPYNGADWQPSEGEDRYRRAVYTYWKRTSPYPSMLTFDSPTREVCVARRVQTNTPLQALVTLNDPVYVEAAQALARRMAVEGGTGPEAQIRHGYRLALVEAPDEATLTELSALYRDALAHYQAQPDEAERLLAPPSFERTMHPTAIRADDAAHAHLAALTVVANAVLNLDGFVMKE